MSASSSRAVATMTGTSDTPRSIRSTSEPSRSGKPRSRTITSGRHSPAAVSAAAPDASVRTAWPDPASPLASASRIRWSSSITSTDATGPR